MTGSNLTASGIGALRCGEWRLRILRTLVRDTQRALADVADVMKIDEEILESVQDIGLFATRPIALVVMGRSACARARLINAILGQQLLPQNLPRGTRWLRIQYGSVPQVHLTLGNSEFELIEELESNKYSWDTLPLKDILRNDENDISTILDIELNNNFLKEGIRIVMPPDLKDVPNKFETIESLRQSYCGFYSKRNIILKHFTPIYFFALDCTGKICFSDYTISRMCGDECKLKDLTVTNDHSNSIQLEESKPTNMNTSQTKQFNTVFEDYQNLNTKFITSTQENVVFSIENCLDLEQMMKINRNSPVCFILLADSVDIRERPNVDMSVDNVSLKYGAEATESTEDVLYHSTELPESDQPLHRINIDPRYAQIEPNTPVDLRQSYMEQCAFMGDLLDRWELICCPRRGSARNDWMILDDELFSSKLSENQSSTDDSVKVKRCNEMSEDDKDLEGDKLVQSRQVLLSSIVKFASSSIQAYLLENCNKLSEIHVGLLQRFILASFELAREMQVVPKKIQYVSTQEQHLYETVSAKFLNGDKKEELLRLMHEVLQEIKIDVNNMDWSVDDLPCHRDVRIAVSNSVFYESTSQSSDHNNLGQSVRIDYMLDEMRMNIEPADSYDNYNFCDYEIIESTTEDSYRSDSLLKNINRNVYDESESMNVIHVENVSDVFSVNSSILSFGRRILERDGSTCKCINDTQVSIKQASLDVQKTVLAKLSRKISMKLVQFADCLRESYFGTLQRCLESLEGCCREELGGRPATEAMRQLLSVAKQVDLQECASFSVLRTLVEHIRRLFHRLRLVGGGGGCDGSGGIGGGACCVLSPSWRRQVALHTTNSLSPTRLARIISSQILDRLSGAHERYQSALSSLEAALINRLHHTEDVKLSIRKRYAPGFARLCLESTSMCDLLMYGKPELGKEIGRGQYGVVYSCRGPWAGREPCAVKSVVPADERHFNELAMEFFHTRTIPEHPRVVRLYGSLVERSPRTPRSPSTCAVLLVSERKWRDLYCAVRTGELDFVTRIRIALDIVEGIRYLHSLGLVHRDVKMKNVLLDREDRASLTDLGFCAPEALISGSVVGTPVHMAPELLTGDYDATVDIYAFGILLWYLCANSVRLPLAFESFHNKEQLWSKVRRGLRPERLPYFTSECWAVMEGCWESEPSARSLLGDVHQALTDVYQHCQTPQNRQEQQQQQDRSPFTEVDSLQIFNMSDGNTL